ncbi:MAG: hypothetical protein H9882_01390 [Candidatus Fournierella pullistercoris]|uniref:Uncharacterized protein n=1 Tax=Candidatus Allofournierella pullistercoris TaxID=2838597 RepID=A0A948T142_9FIRM|nr:hypothetical protein [Candidatus Fournierella pullistercoris]
MNKWKILRQTMVLSWRRGATNPLTSRIKQRPKPVKRKEAKIFQKNFKKGVAFLKNACYNKQAVSDEKKTKR